MIPSELRKKARKSLKGNWGKGACITLAYLLITLLINMILNAFRNNSLIFYFLYIAEIIISIPLSFGLTIVFLKLKRNEDTSSFGFLSEGFSRFSKSWNVFLHILIKMILPIICIIFIIVLMSLLLVTSPKSLVLAILGVALYIVCIVYVVSRGLLYSLAYYIAYDCPDYSAKECVSKSESLMKGNRGNLFLLTLSFIGWMFLSVLTLGIGFIWVFPYIQVSIACFYDEIISSTNTKVVKENQSETEKE